MSSKDEQKMEGKWMDHHRTRTTWGSEMARLQRQRADRRAKSKAKMLREVKMNLAKETVPLTMGQPAFKTNSGWVGDDAGLLAVVSTMANRIGVLNQGVLVEEQDTADLFSKPQQDYTKMLLSAAPKIEFS